MLYHNFHKNNFKAFIFLISLIGFFLVPVNSTQAVDETISVTAEVSNGTSPLPPSSGNSGLGDITIIPKISVRFSGEAYPDATVTVLKEGKEKATVSADKNGHFTITLGEKYDNNIIYSIFTKDAGGTKSVILNYPIALNEGYVTHLSGIRFTPTISIDKLKVHAEDSITIFGYGLPTQQLEVVIEGKNGQNKNIYHIFPNQSGYYTSTFPVLALSSGEYFVYTRYLNDARRSKLIKFIVGELNLLNINIPVGVPGDCNFDSMVNLVDFSVMAFWYKKNNPPPCLDLNQDKIINLIDFSILAFYWTG